MQVRKQWVPTLADSAKIFAVELGKTFGHLAGIGLAIVAFNYMGVDFAWLSTPVTVPAWVVLLVALLWKNKG